MEKQLIQFSKGMNFDINPRNLGEGYYIEGNNIRLINDVSGSSVSITNIKGTEFKIGLPTLQEQTKLSLGNACNNGDLTIYNESSIIDTTNWLLLDLYNHIITNSAYTACYENPTIGTKTYHIYLGDSFLMIVPIDNNVIEVTFTGCSSDSGVLLSTIPLQDNLQIIGSVNLRGDIYLYTTNCTDKVPSSVGQIFKLQYNKITLVVTLTLIYNNYVNFSTWWGISPTSTLGRYENSQIQRIYWTDNYNKLRQLNVADPQALAIDPTILDITPSVDFDIPILTNIINVTGPTIKVGSYQMAYRLSNVSGAVTSFSELSNQVFVADGEPVASTPQQFKNFIGANQGTLEGNHITWVINNLDRDFDRIEFAIVQKENLVATPNIFLVGEQPIFGDSISFTYEGSLETTPITENEFLALSGIFTHCKTIATKDNRLFVANVRNQQSELDFDVRAYRWDSSPKIELINNGITDTYLATPTQIQLPETSDAINPNSDLFKYKSDGTTLGGEGLNVSYEFVTIASRCDQSNGTFNFFTDGVAPWRLPNRNYSEDFIDLGVDSNGIEQEYTNVFTNGKTIGGLKYSNVNGVLKGYQRNETYRLGIQFFDKSKNPYFVKWIGDIKMPDFNDANINSFYEDGITSTGISDFRLVFNDTVDGQLQAFVQSLGIKFIVDNLESISNQISGYSIVRVKRENKDKTIVTSGYISAITDGGTANYLNSPQVNAAGNTTWFTQRYDRVCFITPDFCDPTSLSPTVNQTFKIKGVLKHSNTLFGNILLPVGAPTGSDPYYYFKYYDWIAPVSEQTTTLTNVQFLSFAGTLSTTAGGNPFYNYDFDEFNSDDTKSYSIGNATYYFELNSNNVTLYNDLLTNDIYGKYYVTIERTLTNQYGGNTYTQRANNEYISCGHYKPIQTTSLSIIDDFFVFGADTFVNLYDSNRYAKNLGVTGRGTTTAAYSTTFFLPVESSVNTELRMGEYIQRTFDDQVEKEFQESYQYNTVYSAENDLKTYFPKPDPFLPNNEFDNRFYCSDIKINGELVDSWGLFKETNYWDVEGIYGPINAAIILQDKLYFFQNKAFGIMEVNPRAVVTDVNNTSNSELQLGTGLPLQRHDYISTEVGLQHQWGVTSSSYKLFWLDVANKKFFTYLGGEGISPESDIKGLFSFFQKNLTNNINNYDKPVYFDNIIGINGVRAVYDFKNNEALFCITDGIGSRGEDIIQNNYTFVFNERLNAFTSFYDVISTLFPTDNYRIFAPSMDDLQSIHMLDVGDYGNFFGNVKEAKIKFVSNKDFTETKVYDNIKLDVQALKDGVVGSNDNGTFWSSIRCYNDYMNTDYINFVPQTSYNTPTNYNVTRKERTWKTFIERDRVLHNTLESPNIFDPTYLSPTTIPFAPRMRDKYLIIDLTYNDGGNNMLLITNNVIVDSRVSKR